MSEEKDYIICPNCCLICPKNTQFCDCGYEFKEGETGLTEKQRHRKINKNIALGALFVTFILASFLFGWILVSLIGLALLGIVSIVFHIFKRSRKY